MPYDLLRAIGRPTTGRAYELLGQALDRFVSTTVKTNIRAENRREATFSWLDGWTQLVDERTERSRGMTLELSNWFWEGVLMKGGVLSIDRAFFDITGGRERWLYRVARKHAGGAGEGGFAISMPTLFGKSGAEGPYRRFKFEIIKIAAKNALPGYQLTIEDNGGRKEPMLRMRRDDGPAEPRDPEGKGAQDRSGSATRASPPKVSSRKPFSQDTSAKVKTASPPAGNYDASSLIRGAVAGLSDKATRGYMTDETLTLLRSECPGWDLYNLHAEFESWVNADSSRTPANWQRAFIGYVRRWHEKHRHELRSS